MKEKEFIKEMIKLLNMDSTNKGIVLDSIAFGKKEALKAIRKS